MRGERNVLMKPNLSFTINLDRVHKTLRRNALRLLDLVRDHDDVVNHTKIFPPGYRGFSVCVLPRLQECGLETKTVRVGKKSEKEKIEVVPISEQKMRDDCGADTRNRVQFSEGKVTNGFHAESAKTAKARQIASDLGWKSDEDDAGTTVQATPPERLRLDDENSLKWEESYRYTQINIPNQREEIDPRDSIDWDFLCGAKREAEKEPEVEYGPAVEEAEPKDDVRTDIGNNARPVRCYARKRARNGNGVDNSDSSICVISEVVGHADSVFSGSEDPADGLLIMPKKTNDITKIKGWRRKQFFVERPTTIEFYSYDVGVPRKKRRAEQPTKSTTTTTNKDTDGNRANAFVCDSLDAFLDTESALKVNYEIPHLYAEVGIKLTKEDVASEPNLTADDVSEVGNRYCVRMPNIVDDYLLPPVGVKLEPGTKTKKKTGHSEKMATGVREKEEKKNLDDLPENAVFATKLIGIAVYPSPTSPLPPVVRGHLHRLRSYRTSIDRNWADFAVSAVRGKRPEPIGSRRRILPVYYTAKVEKKGPEVEHEVLDVVKQLVDSVCQSFTMAMSPPAIDKDAGSPAGELESPRTDVVIAPVRRIRTQVTRDCTVVVEKLRSPERYKCWCMEHCCYECEDSGPCAVWIDGVEKALTRREPWKNSAATPAVFDQAMANALARKLRTVPTDEYFFDSIRRLNISSKANSMELVRLNHVKQSFFTGYVFLWYLKKAGAATRAFITFANRSPYAGAESIGRKMPCPANLPRIISEIVSAAKTFDDHEYAILNRTGSSWEIHGMISIAAGKSEACSGANENIEQVFIPVRTRELCEIRQTGRSLLLAVAVKWCVLDLSQDFTDLVLDLPDRAPVYMSRAYLLDVAKTHHGMMQIARQKKRSYGAYTVPSMHPYVLVGPYYVFEKHCHLRLTRNFRGPRLPFEYGCSGASGQKNSLKFFINSVLRELGRSKRVEELYFYDNKNLDGAFHIEAITTSKVANVLSVDDYSVEVEHGYGLNSLKNVQMRDGTRLKTSISKKSLEVPVYLYFQYADLGYFSGELLDDHSIVMDHPLVLGSTIVSHDIGNVFIRFLKRRIRFFPENLHVKWFVTKHKEDLRGRKPFNRFFLSGTYIFCKSELHPILSLTDEKMAELGLDKREILKLIQTSPVFSELSELRKLKWMVCDGSKPKWSMVEVLYRTLQTVREVEETQVKLLVEKQKLEQVREQRWKYFVELVQNSKMNRFSKLYQLLNIKDVYNEMGERIEVTKKFKAVLERYPIGVWLLQKLKRFTKVVVKDWIAEQKLAGVELPAVPLSGMEPGIGEEAGKKLEEAENSVTIIERKKTNAQLPDVQDDPVNIEVKEVAHKEQQVVVGETENTPEVSANETGSEEQKTERECDPGDGKTDMDNVLALRKLETTLVQLCSRFNSNGDDSETKDQLAKQLDLISSHVKSLRKMFGVTQKRKSSPEGTIRVSKRLKSRREKSGGSLPTTSPASPDNENPPRGTLDRRKRMFVSLGSYVNENGGRGCVPGTSIQVETKSNGVPDMESLEKKYMTRKGSQPLAVIPGKNVYVVAGNSTYPKVRLKACDAVVAEANAEEEKKKKKKKKSLKVSDFADLDRNRVTTRP